MLCKWINLSCVKVYPEHYKCKTQVVLENGCIVYEYEMFLLPAEFHFNNWCKV